MIYGRFIGVDRFADVSIRDLAGCSRDAAALYSVFQDGIPAIDAVLILNEDATIARVRDVIRETLDAATEQDAVILTFATHGTHDHRIVAFDSSLRDLDGTTYSLNDLVTAFQRTRAQFVLVILDCCFAGAAPARVVADTPQARGVIDFQGIQGIGKLMLAASRMDEEAYEHPFNRHGLLTAALIDALTQPQGGILAMLEAVIARVRADAASIGVSQNPVATTYVDGGFRLPTLQRGPTYLLHFPEHGAVRTNDIEGLAAFDIPADIVAAWRDDFGNHLHDLQLRAINESRVLDGRSLLVVAPTSSGKTFIGELAAIKAILDGRKAVFLLPFKALVSEKYEDFAYKYGKRLGLRVIRCSGDYRDQTSDFLAGKFDIAVLTYEMFLGLSVSSPTILNLLGLLVLDEAQFIASHDRGIVVELILTLLRTSRSRGIDPQLILLSAVIGNVDPFSAWLSLSTLTSDVRPTPLEFGVLDRDGIYQYLDSDKVERSTQLLPRGRIVRRRDKASSQDVIVPLVQQVMENELERVIVFRSKRGETEGCARYLARELGLPPAQTALDALVNADPSSATPELRAALQGGG